MEKVSELTENEEILIKALKDCCEVHQDLYQEYADPEEFAVFEHGREVVRNILN